MAGGGKYVLELIIVHASGANKVAADKRGASKVDTDKRGIRRRR